MNYLIGDVQGCCKALDRLLAEIGFSPSRDCVYLLGDLVNRGPQSLATLKRLRALGDAAVCLLGNHDLNLLGVAHGARKARRGDTLDDILDAPDREAWLEWLRRRRMAVFEHGWLMVHAGVVPQWDVATTMQLAGEVEACLQSPGGGEFLEMMYSDEPARWSDRLTGHARLRFAVNALTRIRFVSADGTLDLKTKEGAGGTPAGFHPWFDAPGRRTLGTKMAFGHWSTLGLVQRRDLLGLDTGCVWGGKLTAACIGGGEGGGEVEIIQVDCDMAQRPG